MTWYFFLSHFYVKADVDFASLVNLLLILAILIASVQKEQGHENLFFVLAVDRFSELPSHEYVQ